MNPLQTMLQQKNGLHLMWLGNDGWLIWDGSHLYGTDLDLYNPERLAPPPVDPEELAGRLDVHFLSHEHEDHFNSDSFRKLAQKGNPLFVLPQSCAQKGEELALPSSRTRLVRPGDKLELPGIYAECIRAIHGHIGGTVYQGASTLDCGYRFQIGQKVLYQPGDTVLLQEHMEMPPVDVLFVSPTEHNTGVENSLRLIEWLKPAHVLPQHYGTYQEAPENLFWTYGYVDELQEKLGRTAALAYIRLRPGEIWSLPANG